MQRSAVDQRFLQERLDAICQGLKEGVRREVRRLRELGLPVCVADNAANQVVHRNAGNRH